MNRKDGMDGTRTPGRKILYPVDATAAKHGWSVPEETDQPREAYKNRPPIVPAPSPWPLE